MNAHAYDWADAHSAFHDDEARLARLHHRPTYTHRGVDYCAWCQAEAEETGECSQTCDEAHRCSTPTCSKPLWSDEEIETRVCDVCACEAHDHLTEVIA